MRHTLLWLTAAATLITTLGVTSPAHATLMAFRQLVASNPNLNHQYSFEGATLAQRQMDSAGSLNLTPVANGTGSTGAIAYVSGFGGQGLALQPHHVDASNGAGLKSSAGGLTFPAGGFTVELLVAPGPTQASDPGYAVAGPGFPARAYPLLQREGDLKLAAGNQTFADGGALRDVVSNYSQSDWYYVAVNYQNSGGNTVVNGYSANLSAGDTTLTQSLNNEIITGNYSTAATTLGVGIFSQSNLQTFDGLIDEVSIYDTVLSASELDSHLSTLLAPVPEPSSLGLISVGLIGLVRRRKRQRQSRV